MYLAFFNGSPVTWTAELLNGEEAMPVYAFDEGESLKGGKLCSIVGGMHRREIFGRVHILHQALCDHKMSFVVKSQRRPPFLLMIGRGCQLRQTSHRVSGWTGAIGQL